MALTVPPHSPVSHDHHLEHLDDLVAEERHTLEVVFGADLLQCIKEHLVVRLGQLDAREQVRDDAIEEWDVVSEELGQVHVYDGAQQLQR